MVVLKSVIISLCLIVSFKGEVIIKQVGESNGTADRLKKLELPNSDSFLVIIGNPDFSVNLCNVFDKYRRNRCCCSIVFKKKAEYRVSSNEVFFFAFKNVLQAISVYGITNDGIVIAFAEVVSRIKEFHIPKVLLYE